MWLDTSASVSAAVSIGLLEKADRLLAGFGAITLLADRALLCAELLGWLEKQPSWTSVMRLPGDTEIHGTAAPLGCQVRRLRLRRGQCRGFRNVRLWADGSHTANLLLAHPTGLAVEEPWYLISNAEPALDLVWSYGRCFCCEQLFRDQKSGLETRHELSTNRPGRSADGHVCCRSEIDDLAAERDSGARALRSQA